MMNMQSNGEDNDMANVFCLDTLSCSILTPVEQLINILTDIDPRLAEIDKEVFLESIISMARDEAMLIHMH